MNAPILTCADAQSSMADWRKVACRAITFYTEKFIWLHQAEAWREFYLLIGAPAGTLVALIIGVHNVWDIVLWITEQARR